jgi:FMN phosphatase YigB (HAD superfamily)
MPKDFPAPAALVFLFDVDNTLLDNDGFAVDLRERLVAIFGEAQADRYWQLYDELKAELGYADYLGAIQRFRHGLEDHPALLSLAEHLLGYGFAQRLFPRALEVLAHLQRTAPAAILSDGDVVFQPHKIRRSGLWSAVNGRVMICVHKERALDAMQRHFPARHYVMVDDKPQILAAMKRIMGATLTTVFVRQGHYAQAGAHESPLPDISVHGIGDLLTFTSEQWQARL